MSYLLVVLLAVVVLVGVFVIAIHLGFRAPKIESTDTPKTRLNVDFLSVLIPVKVNKHLSGWLLPIEGAQETLVVLHGWGSNAAMMLPLALPFYQAGMNVLLFDARSHGQSDADTFSSLPRFAEDIGSAIDWLKGEYPDRAKKIALLGHSVGAGAVLFEASRRTDIAAVISVSAFAHPEWMMQRYLQSLHIPAWLRRKVIRYVEWVIEHRFTTFAPINTVCRIRCPILMVHGKDDLVIPVDDARAILRHCPAPHLRLIEIEGAGHSSVDKIELHADTLIQFLREAGFTGLKH
ncbi:alpha/beta fold hydrolase [Amphritea opalescens]|uniref:Alpha/beta fold hydrolase n=1 Tax=Amphritea opalescens TaxID=2490544 RepID=A0A430KLQ6_9GAMM|nr:alpha/beta fold hydrolase [Amphritea opalescens]RTE64410.1 alpha/beta fold hydrolase [Amphritea opalescens]